MKKIIHTDQAPGAVGPYSQAVEAGGFLFCSGQIPLDPKTMKVVEGGVEAQTRQVLENLKAVVEAAGANLSQVLKTTVLLDDIENFKAMNAVYAEYFSPDENPPARAAFQVSALPLGVQVEIEAVVKV